jgi:hypothetical protein
MSPVEKVLRRAGLGWPRKLAVESHVKLTGDNQQHLPPPSAPRPHATQLLNQYDSVQGYRKTGRTGRPLPNLYCTGRYVVTVVTGSHEAGWPDG